MTVDLYIVTFPDGRTIGVGEFPSPEVAGEQLAGQLDWPPDTDATKVNVLKVTDEDKVTMSENMPAPQPGAEKVRTNMRVAVSH